MRRKLKFFAAVFYLACAAVLEAADPIFYPSLPETPRLQFLKSYSTQKDLGRSQNWFARFVFGPEKEGSIVGKPYGIAAHGSKIYVCDTGKDVRILDIEKQQLHWLGAVSQTQLKKPINITIDEKGTKFICDAGLSKVVVFDSNDKFVTSYEDPAGWKPVDAAVWGTFIYVLDIENHTVKVLDRAGGKVLRKIGSVGSQTGQLFKPTNIAVDASGNVYVSDTMNFRIEKFSPDGAYLKSFGEVGRTPGTFSRPKGIAIDRQGHIYAIDAAFDNVQIFDEHGNVLMFFGGTGNDPGQMYLPAKVAIDYDLNNARKFQELADPRLRIQYLVWVTNQYGPNRISVYGFGEWQEKKVAP